jgi:hypothetical protein
MHSEPLIADRAEFVDVLNLLRRGRVLVRASDSAGGCLLDGGIVYHSWEPLSRFGLIDEFDNPEGFPHAHYYRLSERGREFAERACQAWRQQSIWQRIAVRFTG